MQLQSKLIVLVLIAGAILLAGCGNPQVGGSATTTPQDVATLATTPTATPVPTMLVVCLGQQPNTLYPYGGPNQAAQILLQALFDGPVDHQSYAYQPIILEALPDIAQGTASLQAVQVILGDTVLDDEGNVTALDYGTFIRPSGCTSSDCAIPFDGTEVEMDQMVALFTLHPGLSWADGTPLTTSDSLYGYSLNTDPNSLADQYKVQRTQSYDAVDQQVIQWTGIPGFIDPDYQSNFWLPAPQHAWGGLTPSELATSPEASQTPLGYGPYQIAEFQPDRITLQRNPNYFRASEGLPIVDRLVFRVVGQDAQTNLEMLRTGECDLLDPSAAYGISAAEIAQLEEQGELVASWANSSGWTLLNFGIVPQSYDDENQWWAGDRPDFFGDVRTRQALAMCIDRQGITDEVTLGAAPVLNSYLPADHPLYDPEIPAYAFDQQKAGELLDEVGWLMNANTGIRAASQVEGVRDNTLFSVELLYVTHPQNEAIVQMVADDLATCGIELALTGLSSEALFAIGEEGPVFGRNFDLAFFAWQASADPPCHLYLSDALPGENEERFPLKWGGWNATGWANEEYDTACKTARGSVPGQPGFADNHILAQNIFMSEIPAIPFFYYQQAALARPDICGFDYDPTAGLLWNVETLAYGSLCP